MKLDVYCAECKEPLPAKEGRECWMCNERLARRRDEILKQFEPYESPHGNIKILPDYDRLDDQLAETLQRIKDDPSCSIRPGHDPVNQPSHYTAGAIECIDAIEAWGLGFHLGNLVKYTVRAGKKDPSMEIQDLEKARWYLDRHIKNLKEDSR